MIRLLLVLAVAALATAHALPAAAQLGSVNNPPPQNLFNFNDGSNASRTPSMAERRQQLARHRRAPRRTAR